MTRKFVPCINNPETEEIYSALKTFCCLWLKKFPLVSTCVSGIVKFTRRKHSMKFRQIGYTTSQYAQSFFPKTISAWNGFAFAEAPSLAVFR